MHCIWRLKVSNDCNGVCVWGGGGGGWGEFELEVSFFPSHAVVSVSSRKAYPQLSPSLGTESGSKHCVTPARP